MLLQFCERSAEWIHTFTFPCTLLSCACIVALVLLQSNCLLKFSCLFVFLFLFRLQSVWFKCKQGNWAVWIRSTDVFCVWAKYHHNRSRQASAIIDPYHCYDVSLLIVWPSCEHAGLEACLNLHIILNCWSLFCRCIQLELIILICCLLCKNNACVAKRKLSFIVTKRRKDLKLVI